jgi:integrase
MAKRRGHGEGSIVKRGDGRYEGRVDLGWQTVNGKAKRRSKSVYGKTKSECLEKLRSVQRDVEAGLPVRIERQTVEQYMTHWLEHTVRTNRRPKTYRSYEGLVRLHIIPALGRHQLQKLSPQHVQAFLNQKRESKLSGRTVQYIHATLRAALNHAVRMDLVKRNVAMQVQTPRAPRHEISPLTPEQARRLLNVARSHRLGALFSVALALGLRQGEALGLRWQDVNLDDGTLRVVNQLQRVDGELRLVPPKSEQSRRTIAIPDAVIQQLRTHRIAQLQERLAAGENWVDSGHVFTSEVGTPLDDANVRRIFKRLLQQAGLPAIRYHDLRHSTASLMLAQNVHPRIVMETLGHSQISLTMNTYSHVAPQLQREAANRMNNLFADEKASS